MTHFACHMSLCVCHMSYVKCLCWSLRHSEQFLFSCLWSKVTYVIRYRSEIPDRYLRGSWELPKRFLMTPQEVREDPPKRFVRTKQEGHEGPQEDLKDPLRYLWMINKGWTYIKLHFWKLSMAVDRDCLSWEAFYCTHRPVYCTHNYGPLDRYW